MKKLNVRLQLGYYMNDAEGRVGIHIEDQGTGIRIMEFDLTPAQFRGLLSATSTTIEATLCPEDAWARLGRRMMTEIISLGHLGTHPEPKSITDAITHEQEKRVGQDIAISARATNTGWQLVVYTYLPDNEEAVALDG